MNKFNEGQPSTWLYPALGYTWKLNKVGWPYLCAPDGRNISQEHREHHEGDEYGAPQRD